MAQSVASRPDDRVETRKIQLIGGSTFAVSLPKPWIDVMGLAAGEELVLHPRPDGSILLVPRADGRHAAHKRRVKAPSDPDALVRLLIGLYVAGTEVIELELPHGATRPILAAVDEACQRLLGLQVVDERPTSITLQDLADPTELQSRRALRMMHLTAHRMLQDVEVLLGGRELPEGLGRREAELDRLLLLMFKQHRAMVRDLSFTDARGIVPLEGLDQLLVALYLERIGDYATRIAELDELATTLAGTRLADHMTSACQIALTCVDDAVKAFASQDLELANGTIARVANLSKRAQEVPLDELTSDDQGHPLPARSLCLGFVRVFECLERIGLYSKSIAETAINRTALDLSERSP